MIGRVAPVLALLLLVATACRTEVTVGIDVNENGSGVVTVTATLDSEAASQLGDPASLSLADLTTAGWKVAGVTRSGDGDLVLSASRSFASPTELQLVLDEIGGRNGVFRNSALTVSNGFASTTTEFSTQVELTGTLDQFSDPQLAAALGGLPLGRTPEELAALGADAAEAATLVVRVRLPGGTPDTNGTVDGRTSTWSFPITGGTPTSATLRSSATDHVTTKVVLVAAGAGLLLLAVVATVIGLVRRRRS